MTPEQLDAIRARLDAATPGPWGTRNDGRTTVYAVDETGVIRSRGQRCAGDEFPMVARVSGEANSALIANAPSDLAALLAYVEQLEGLLRDLCEDSRAAAEVVRLRGVIESVVWRIDVDDPHMQRFSAMPTYANIVRRLRAALNPPQKE